jgi:ATP-dependent DNA helicase RecG
MQRLGLLTDWDLVLHLPLRHEDETRIDPLAQGHDGQTLQFEGTVTHSEVSLRPRRQLRVTVLDAADGRSSCVLRFMHFYPQHQKTLAVGERVRVRGELRVGLWGREMVHPTFKPASAPLPQGLTPVYPSGAGLAQAYLRKAVAGALQRVLDERRWQDTLTPEIASQIGLQRFFDLRKALLFLHNPTPDSAAVLQGDRDHPAWQRLKLEELLAQQLSQQVARRERARSRAPVLAGTAGTGGQGTDMPLADALLAALPFGLTGAQTRVSAEIAADLARPVPMHRLLQGDVGAGKTVVAALAACRCMDAGWQCALMAPTEILAQQHFAKLVGWLAPLLAQRGLTVAWLTGSQKKKAREAMAAQVASGQAGLVVGTHALIQDSVQFARLGLAVIDEQHRFGVAQRLALRGKLEGSPQADGAQEPHLLMMTATPIPRTLAMSHLADLDVSTLDELPPGRTPIVTRVVSDERRDEVVERIAAQVAQGRQVYWVCPLIQESEAALNAASNAGEGPSASDDGRKLALQDLRNVTDTHAELSDALPGVGVGLLHSRLPPAEKQAVMDAFARGELSVLVSTTVIEVGVDVPNASLMVIDHAERFGLSQLHQLRGRVGRGAVSSACVLLYTAPLSPTGRERLKAMAQTNDGFEIARIDLALRGPGEFLGARQSGEAMLRFADLATDDDLLELARHAAPLMLDRYPVQAQAHMQRWLGARAEFLKA